MSTGRPAKSVRDSRDGSGGGLGGESEDMKPRGATRVLILCLVVFAMVSWACSARAELKTATPEPLRAKPTSTQRPTITPTVTKTKEPAATPTTGEPSTTDQ